MKFDIGTILILGVVGIAGYWCFTSGPCKDFLKGKVDLAGGPPNPSTGIVNGRKVSGDEMAAAQIQMMKDRPAFKLPTAAYAGWYP